VIRSLLEIQLEYGIKIDMINVRYGFKSDLLEAKTDAQRLAAVKAFLRTCQKAGYDPLAVLTPDPTRESR
jgi:hypothetical protein